MSSSNVVEIFFPRGTEAQVSIETLKGSKVFDGRDERGRTNHLCIPLNLRDEETFSRTGSLADVAFNRSVRRTSVLTLDNCSRYFNFHNLTAADYRSLKTILHNAVESEEDKVNLPRYYHTSVLFGSVDLCSGNFTAGLIDQLSERSEEGTIFNHLRIERFGRFCVPKQPIKCRTLTLEAYYSHPHKLVDFSCLDLFKLNIQEGDELSQDDLVELVENIVNHKVEVILDIGDAVRFLDAGLPLHLIQEVTLNYVLPEHVASIKELKSQGVVFSLDKDHWASVVENGPDLMSSIPDGIDISPYVSIVRVKSYWYGPDRPWHAFLDLNKMGATKLRIEIERVSLQNYHKSTFSMAIDLRPVRGRLTKGVKATR
uniref:Uncharacterized protein n=1 Tax=viral metagenome TaxID=1070528 RepID=A0A6C0JTF4_9ZZZZ